MVWFGWRNVFRHNFQVRQLIQLRWLSGIFYWITIVVSKFSVRFTPTLENFVWDLICESVLSESIFNGLNPRLSCTCELSDRAYRLLKSCSSKPWNLQGCKKGAEACKERSCGDGTGAFKIRMAFPPTSQSDAALRLCQAAMVTIQSRENSRSEAIRTRGFVLVGFNESAEFDSNAKNIRPSGMLACKILYIL